MKFLLSLGAATAALLLALAPAGAAVSPQDQTFATTAGQGGMAEVQAAKMALEKSKDPAVLAFARQMVTDHTKANNQLIAIVKSEGLTPPAAIDQADQTMADHLSTLSGSAFDTAYLKGQEVAHKRTIALFVQEAGEGSNPQLVAFAKMTLPTLKMHYAMVTKDVAAM